MAVVPFRVSGAAADQGAQERLFQISDDTITIRQRPAAAKAMRDHALRVVLQVTGCSHVRGLPFQLPPPCPGGAGHIRVSPAAC